ncbi:MAG: mannose-6-phosphate isomerase, class I, partial [Kiritimatiellae bacterium]|nr:mannose-6-phosphate isomerase, class I [Kiritimatiellia bacterium]
GYARENALGIPLTAPQRNYKDCNHKPETVCALTPFTLLCGFRKVSEILSLFARLGVTHLRREIGLLAKESDRDGLKKFFSGLFRMSPARKAVAVAEAAGKARALAGNDSIYEWVVKLQEYFPNDVGVLAPLFLNLVTLEPGRALLLYPGQLHAYLGGMALEVMANSDNVLRGGLTSKHVDIRELLQVVSFWPTRVRKCTARPRGNNETVYPSHAREYRLSRIELDKGSKYENSSLRSVEIVLCVCGRAVLTCPGREENVVLTKGVSALIPAAVTAYRMWGKAIIYRVWTP